MTTNNNFTREDIAESLHNEFGLTKKDCNFFVKDIIETLIAGLQKNGFVKIHNFGTFRIKRKSKRIGRNPKTKENVIINERNVISFKPSKSVIEYLNKNNEN